MRPVRLAPAVRTTAHTRHRWRRASARSLRAAVAVAVVTALMIGGNAVAAPGAPAHAASSGIDYTSFVDPFVSTAGDDGNDLPGAQAPNGLAKVNPLTVPGRNHTGYDYNQSQIAGFTQTNLDGVGGSGGGGDILVVPTSVAYTARPSTGSYAHPFSHSDEQATPGYYRVGLGAIAGTDGAVTHPGGTIAAEVTAATRTAVHRYAFPQGATPSLVVDLANNFTSRTASSVTVTALSDGRAALSGTVAGSFNGAKYALNYYAETEQKTTSVRTWADGSALDSATTRSGTDTGAILTFGTADASEIGLRITLSPISAEQAHLDQTNEVGGKGFDAVRSGTAAEWNTRLGAVEIGSSAMSDPDGSLTRLFYTHLYRMFAAPTNATSTSGTYRGVDGLVHQVDDFTYYDGWSSWDDFRKFSVIAYVDPALYRNMIQSLISLFADQAASGASSLSSLTQSVPSVRWERSAVIVADALSKGYRDFARLDEAYPALQNLIGYYSGQELRQGYVVDRPGVSLERGYDQWALAIIADAIGRTADAATLREQAAMPFSHVFRPGAWTAADGTAVGLLTPRSSSGDWSSVDYERFEAANLYQGTPWQYNWYGAYDMAATTAAMGGTKATALALRHMFGEDGPDDGSGMLHSNANEIDLQAPYLFNYVGEPSLTQKWVRAIYTKETWNRYLATGSTNEVPSGHGEFTPPVKTKVYKLDPSGFLPTMDNDAGTMSTMFVAAAIGLFPVTAGSSQYQIGSPFFDSATIRYDTGRSFTVSANGVSADAFYVQSATRGGRDFGNTWLDYRDIVAGGDLSLRMGTAASAWGSNTQPAYSLSTAGAVPGDAAGYPVAATGRTIAADAAGAVDGSAELTIGGGATLAAPVGTDLVASGAAALAGLPDTITGSVTVSSPTTATVRVRGTITKNVRYHVEFSDAALADGARSSGLTGQGVSDRDALQLTVSAADRVDLQTVLDDAVLVQRGNYSPASYSSLTSAVTKAQSVISDAAASSSDLRAAAAGLRAAIDGLGLDQGAYRVLQAEASDAWSGGQLKNESYQSAGNLGGVTSGSWVRYENLDFAGKAPQRLAIRFANAQATSAAASTVVLHAGDENGAVVGSASLAGTGSWSTYQTVNAAITDPAAVASARAITLTFTAPGGQQWVANFDWFQFLATASDDAPAPIVVQAESWVATSGGALKNESSTWTSGGVTNVGGTYDGAWLDYGQIDFGSTPITSFSAHYVNNSSRVGKDSRIDVYLDAADPSSPGTPVTSLPLAVTGSNWSADGEASVALQKAITGKHRLTIVLRTTADAGHPYVANIDSLTFVPSTKTGAVVEAEAWTANSGRGLKSESSTWSDGAVTNLGGTYDGAWLDYGTIDVGGKPVTNVSVHYVNNSSRVGKDSRIDLYLDGFDTTAPGTPTASIPLPVTGSNWSQSGTATVALPTAITGAHRFGVVLRTTPDSGHPYVGNIDRFTFDAGVDLTVLRAAISAAAAYEAQTDAYGAIDVEVFGRELAAARSLLAQQAPTQAAVDARARSLRLATSQLTPIARLRLAYLVRIAQGVENARYTATSWTAFGDALSAATATLSDSGATDAALTGASDALTTAQNGLVRQPLAVPGVPTGVTATAQATAVTVRWAAPTSDGGTAVTGYVVTLDDGHTVTIDDPTQTAAVFTWLPAGGVRTARVAAVNAVGTSAASEPTVAVTTASADAGAAGGAAPTSFSAATLSAAYSSDSWPATPNGQDYNVYLLRGFSDLGPGVLAPNTKLAGEPTALNDAKMLEINHSATTAEVDRAQRDADNSPATTMTDALGSTLGPIFQSAMAGGKLPKTQAILDRMSSGLGGADAAKPFFQYQRPFVRMGLASGGGLVYDNKTGGYSGLESSGSYPSGHTFGGYLFGTTMATLLPELAPQLLARASEYGNNRIVLGFHYPLDVMGGRIDAQAIVAHRWADPQFAQLLQAARQELEQVLLSGCRDAGAASTLAGCVGTPYGGMDASASTAIYSDRLTYGFSQIGPSGQALKVPSEATALLSTVFPDLSAAQREQILQQTALDSGYPLDLTAQGDSSWQRIDLAKAFTAQVRVNGDGSVTVMNYDDQTRRSIATASAISVAGRAIDGFDPATRSYVVDWPAATSIPAVTGTPTEAGATVSVQSPSARRLLQAPRVQSTFGRPAVQTIVVTSADGNSTRSYTVSFWSTADDHRPAGLDSPGGDGGGGGNGTPGSHDGDAPGAERPGADPSAGGRNGMLPVTGGVPEMTPLAVGAVIALLAGAVMMVRTRQSGAARR